MVPMTSLDIQERKVSIPATHTPTPTWCMGESMICQRWVLADFFSFKQTTFPILFVTKHFQDCCGVTYRRVLAQHLKTKSSCSLAMEMTKATPVLWVFSQVP